MYVRVKRKKAKEQNEKLMDVMIYSKITHNRTKCYKNNICKNRNNIS